MDKATDNMIKLMLQAAGPMAVMHPTEGIQCKLMQPDFQSTDELETTVSKIMRTAAEKLQEKKLDINYAMVAIFYAEELMRLMGDGPDSLRKFLEARGDERTPYVWDHVSVHTIPPEARPEVRELIQAGHDYLFSLCDELVDVLGIKYEVKDGVIHFF